MSAEKPVQPPKYGIEIRQTPQGFWYVASLQTNGDSLAELSIQMNEALEYAIRKLVRLNNSHDGQESSDLEQPFLPTPEEIRLFERMRELRRNLASQANVPPYVIFHDSVLWQFARLKPKTKEEVLRIPNVGEKRYEKYGQLFLDVLNKE